jgi:hypothetical protein
MIGSKAGLIANSTINNYLLIDDMGNGQTEKYAWGEKKNNHSGVS